MKRDLSGTLKGSIAESQDSDCDMAPEIQPIIKSSVAMKSRNKNKNKKQRQKERQEEIDRFDRENPFTVFSSEDGEGYDDSDSNGDTIGSILRIKPDTTATAKHEPVKYAKDNGKHDLQDHKGVAAMNQGVVAKGAKLMMGDDATAHNAIPQLQLNGQQYTSQSLKSAFAVTKAKDNIDVFEKGQAESRIVPGNSAENQVREDNSVGKRIEDIGKEQEKEFDSMHRKKYKKKKAKKHGTGHGEKHEKGIGLEHVGEHDKVEVQ